MEIKDWAESSFGVEVIILHQLGYKLDEQADLTPEQKDFLKQAYVYYHNEVNPEVAEGEKGKKGKSQNMKEIKRMVKASGR